MLRTLSTASAKPTPLRRFLVERYPGWMDGADSLTSSECEALSMAEVLKLADDEGRSRWEALNLGYPDQQGSEFLRAQVAQLYRSIDPSQINILAPAEGIYLAMRALLSPGQHVVVTEPSYQSLGEVARSIGCEVSAWAPEFGAGGTSHFVPDTLRKREAGLIRTQQLTPTPQRSPRSSSEQCCSLSSRIPSNARQAVRYYAT
jgi:hypothetical protein